jgi:hypothetical protein
MKEIVPGMSFGFFIHIFSYKKNDTKPTANLECGVSKDTLMKLEKNINRM